jgi:hypothetical protein
MVDVNKVSEIGRHGAEQGYETVKEYAGKSVDAIGDLSSDLRQFVGREPWIALAAAFAVGYLAARMIRGVSN